MTQEDLAEIMEVSRQTVAKWEADAAYPEIDKLIKLADFFHCTVDQLLREDLNVSREAYSPVRLVDVEGFRMARYAVVSPAPEDDAMNHVRRWAEENGLFSRPGGAPEIIGWNFPCVSQEQINVFHMHGYAAACILPEDFVPKCPDMEFAEQTRAKYAVLTVKEPFSAAFDLIPNAFKTVQSYLEVNGLKMRLDGQVLPDFEKVYQRDGACYMDVYVSVDV